MNSAGEFQKKIGINFSNLDLLKESLTHKSYINENKHEESAHNERLEFLGDAVLELVVSNYLFANYPEHPEGDLTSFRSALVRTESLAEEALRIGFGEYILMSNGEEATGGRVRPYILANTMEAVIGAIYLDNGMEKVTSFIIKNICYKLDKIIKERLDIDAKSKLQEISQDLYKITPTYDLITEEGPDHDKKFTMAVFIDTAKLSEGTGSSKQSAEQDAAQNALRDWDEVKKKLDK